MHVGCCSGSPCRIAKTISSSAAGSVARSASGTSPPSASARRSAPASSPPPAPPSSATRCVPAPGPRSCSRSCSRRSPAASRRSATPSSRRWCRSPGSAYTYAYASLGELVAWIIGWDLIVEYAVGNIGVAIGWSGYFRELLSHFGVSHPGLARDRLPIGAHGGGGGRRRRDRPDQQLPRLRHRTAPRRLRPPVHRQSARLR